MCDFLPAGVHRILSDIESSLSLPALIIIVLCTIQFMIYHSMHIACVVNEIYKKKAEESKKKKRLRRRPGLMQLIQKSLCEWLAGNSCNTSKRRSYRRCRPRKRRCDDDDDDDIDDDSDDDDSQDDL